MSTRFAYVLASACSCRAPWYQVTGMKCYLESIRNRAELWPYAETHTGIDPRGGNQKYFHARDSDSSPLEAGSKLGAVSVGFEIALRITRDCRTQAQPTPGHAGGDSDRAAVVAPAAGKYMKQMVKNLLAAVRGLLTPRACGPPHASCPWASRLVPATKETESPCLGTPVH